MFHDVDIGAQAKCILGKQKWNKVTKKDEQQYTTTASFLLKGSIDDKRMDRPCQFISEDRCYNLKTKLKSHKIICHITYHIKNVNNWPQFLIYVRPKNYCLNLKFPIHFFITYEKSTLFIKLLLNAKLLWSKLLETIWWKSNAKWIITKIAAWWMQSNFLSCFQMWLT